MSHKILVLTRRTQTAMFGYPMGSWRSFLSSAKRGDFDVPTYCGGRRERKAVPVAVTWILFVQPVARGAAFALLEVLHLLCWHGIGLYEMYGAAVSAVLSSSHLGTIEVQV